MAETVPSLPPAAVIERAKIYGHPKSHQHVQQPSANQQLNVQPQQQQALLFPKINPHQIVAAAVEVPGGLSTTASNKYVPIAQVNLVLDQMDRVRAVLRDRELDLLKLRHENIILKQIERRQQKEIQHLDLQSHDAPKLIRSLRDEISALKLKLKTYYTQLNSETRRVRSLNDECLRLKDVVGRLEAITIERELEEREVLTRRVGILEGKLSEKEGILADAQKKSDMVEKLLNNENRSLRGKIHNLSAENTFLKDKIVKLSDIIQDKDKEIASLSIYRYNAVHKKVDQTVCKKCEQRDKQESEQKRRQAIIDEIPALPPPSVSIVDGSTVQAIITAPYSNSAIEYSKITLKVSSDPSHSTIIREYNVPVKKREDNADQDTEFTAEVIVDTLKSGQYYHFFLVAGHENIDGLPSTPTSLLVDELPKSPNKPETAHSIMPPLIQLFIPATPCMDDTTIQKASPAISYQIYHSNDAEMKESFLIGEIAVVQDKPLKFLYANAEIGVRHYFKVAAVNIMGIGQFSEVSDAVLMDTPPNAPSKPSITKLDSKSLHLQATCDPHGGTDIETWKIMYAKSQQDPSKPAATSSLYVECIGPGGGVGSGGVGATLDYLVDGLEAGETYVFTVVAISPGGESEVSEGSDEVNLDMMVPVPDPPEVEILSGVSVRIIFPEDVIERYGDIPKLLGYKLFAYLEGSARVYSTAECGIEERCWIIDELEMGASYNFAMALIGENSTAGLPSELVFAPLAAGIPLPQSPDHEPQSDNLTSTDHIRDDPDAPAPAPLKGKSKSRSLSLTQKSQNMHDGNPAHHDPEEEKHLNIGSVSGLAGGKKAAGAKSNSNLKHGKPPAVPRGKREKSTV